MVAALPSGATTLEAALESVRRTPSGGYELQFSDSSAPVAADFVVLALPFTALQDVDLDDAGLSDRKRAAIEQLGMGTNSKVLLQLDRSYRSLDRWSSFLRRSDDPRFATWESSDTDRDASRYSLITCYSGGRAGTSHPADRAHGVARPEVGRSVLAALDEMVPGVAAAQVGDVWLDQWADDPWVRGSYAAFLPGHTTSFWGTTGQAEGRIHFAGEHTSVYSQGYLNGGVESGGRVAAELLGALDRELPSGLTTALREQTTYEPTYPWGGRRSS
jgi:monoamine oxidase